MKINISYASYSKLKKGDPIEIVTLKEILDKCTALPTPDSNNKGEFGVIYPYLSSTKCDSSASGGVLFIDIDECNEHSDLIISHFEEIAREIPCLIAMNKSHSSNLHIFLYDEDVKNDVSLYKERSSMFLALIAKVILEKTDIDLRTIPNALDTHNTSIHQGLYLNRTPYKYNEHCEHYSIPEETKNILLKEYSDILPPSSQKTNALSKKRNSENDGSKGNTKKESLECVQKPNSLFVAPEKLQPKHYRYDEKYKIANTLAVAGYNSNDIAKFLIQICLNLKNEKTFENELRGIASTAIRKNEIHSWAVEELKEHGIHLDFNINVDKFINSEPSIENGILPEYHCKFDMGLGYMSDYVGDNSEININDISNKFIYIHADCGAGKTEWIKRYAQNHICDIIQPMNSVVDGKFNDTTIQTITKHTDYRLDKSQLMILDKYAQVDISKETIIIDESHILISHSEFRDEMLSKVINKLNNNTDVKKVILLTGTPMGEHLFFGDTYNIRLFKDSENKKIVNIHFTDNIDMSLKKSFQKCKEGGVIPFVAANRQQPKLITIFKNLDLKYGEYKKDKRRSEFVKNINENNSIGDVDTFISTSYLNVGNEIKEDKNIQLFIPNWNNEKFSAGEIHQFANRLRNSDLIIHIYLKKDLRMLETPFFNEDLYADDSLAQQEITKGDFFAKKLQRKYKWINDDGSINTDFKEYKKMSEDILCFLQSFKNVIDILKEYGYEIKYDDICHNVKTKVKNEHNTKEGIFEWICEYGVSDFINDFERHFNIGEINEDDFNTIDFENGIPTISVTNVNYVQRLYPILKSLYEIIDSSDDNNMNVPNAVTQNDDFIDFMMNMNLDNAMYRKFVTPMFRSVFWKDDMIADKMKTFQHRNNTINISKCERYIDYVKNFDDDLINEISSLKEQGLLSKENFDSTFNKFMNDRYKNLKEIEPRKDIYMEIFKMVNENDDVSISGILNNISGESLPDNRRTAVVMEKDGVRKEWSSLTEFCDENNFDYKNAKIGFCKRGHYKGWHKVA